MPSLHNFHTINLSMKGFFFSLLFKSWPTCDTTWKSHESHKTHHMDTSWKSHFCHMLVTRGMVSTVPAMGWLTLSLQLHKSHMIVTWMSHESHKTHHMDTSWQSHFCHMLVTRGMVSTVPAMGDWPCLCNYIKSHMKVTWMSQDTSHGHLMKVTLLSHVGHTR